MKSETLIILAVAALGVYWITKNNQKTTMTALGLGRSGKVYPGDIFTTPQLQGLGAAQREQNTNAYILNNYHQFYSSAKSPGKLT